MAKILYMSIGKNSIDCILSGSIGDTVWVNRKGINYKRSKRTTINQPNSPAQLVQRARFNTILRFLKPLTNFLRVGFQSQTASMSPFNAAMSCNFKGAIEGTYPEFRIDYSKAMVSRGNLPGALNPQVTFNKTGRLEFSWDNNSMIPYAMADDKVMLVVYNPEKQQAITIEEGNIRIIGSHSITLPSSFEGDEVQCYIAFKNSWQKKVSDSRYVGGIVVSGER